MRIHKPSRSFAEGLELRRLASDAAAQFAATFNRPSGNLPSGNRRAGDRRANKRPSSLSHELSNQHRPALQAHILPLDEQGKAGTSCRIEVKDFDERGITFQHSRPLHDRRALVVLEGPNHERIAAEVDLSWCRFSQRGQYTSGGRFVSLVGMSA